MVLLVSIFFGGLTIGGFSVQTMGIPSQIVTMVQGAILLFVLGGELLAQYKYHVATGPRKGKNSKEAM